MTFDHDYAEKIKAAKAADLRSKSELNDLLGPDDLIEVVCWVFPTGEVFWMEALDENGKYRKDYSDKVLKKYKAKHPELDGTDCTIGAVNIRMPRKNYIAIGAAVGPGCFEWP